MHSPTICRSAKIVKAAGDAACDNNQSFVTEAGFGKRLPPGQTGIPCHEATASRRRAAAPCLMPDVAPYQPSELMISR
jgi:hypothetical protein